MIGRVRVYPETIPVAKWPRGWRILPTCKRRVYASQTRRLLVSFLPMVSQEEGSDVNMISRKAAPLLIAPTELGAKREIKLR